MVGVINLTPPSAPKLKAELLAENTKLLKQLGDLKAAGAQLSDCAYNLAQLKNHRLTDRERQTLLTCREFWDKSVKATHD